MTYQLEASEAVCSALYQMPFTEFLGEQEHPLTGEHVAWFHLGEKPKDMRVAVVMPHEKEEVRVVIEWRNYFTDGRNPLKGEQTLTISTYSTDQAEVRAACEQAVLKVLEVFTDVLQEEGVAGQISDLVESEESESEEQN